MTYKNCIWDHSFFVLFGLSYRLPFFHFSFVRLSSSLPAGLLWGNMRVQKGQHSLTLWQRIRHSALFAPAKCVQLIDVCLFSGMWKRELRLMKKSGKPTQYILTQNLFLCGNDQHDQRTVQQEDCSDLFFCVFCSCILLYLVNNLPFKPIYHS